MTTATAITVKEIGTNVKAVKTVKTFLTGGQFKSAHTSCLNWYSVGDINSRIKAFKLEHKVKGKVLELVNDFYNLSDAMTQDELTYSVRMYEAGEALTKWHKDSKSKKHNPRGIFTAWNLHLNPVTDTDDETGDDETTTETDENCTVDGAKALLLTFAQYVSKGGFNADELQTINAALNDTTDAMGDIVAAAKEEIETMAKAA